MTDDTTTAPTFATRRWIVRLRRAGLVLTLLLVLVAITAAAVWLNRRAAARQVLTGWLEQRGIDADVEVERVEVDGFVGRIVIGDPRNPDFVVERVEVDYAVGLPWSETGLGVRPSRIRLLRPILKATWTDGALSLGSLDPLIDEFTGRPPGPDSQGPVVIVESGRLRLSTEYGPLQVLADATIDDGKLMRLSARMPEASLKSGAVEARGLQGTIDLTTTGDRVAVKLDARANRFSGPGLGGEGAVLSGTGSLPYPDLKTRRGDGRAVLNATLGGNSLSFGDIKTRRPRAVLAFDGTTKGWIQDFRITGQTSVRASAMSLDGAGLSARNVSTTMSNGSLRLSRTQTGLDWQMDAPVRLVADQAAAAGFTFVDLAVGTTSLKAGGTDGNVEASGPLALTAGRAALGDLALKQARAQVDLDMTRRDGTTLTRATGALTSAGGEWPLFGPVKGDDLPELVEMKRALGDFSVSMPALRLMTGSPGTELILTRSATLRPRNGGTLTIGAVQRPIFAAEPGQQGGGALTAVATRGAGLPEARFSVPDWRLTPGGFQARLDGRAALDFGLARGLTLTTQGLLTNEAGRLTYVTGTCIPFTVDRLELDDNDATALSGRFCPPTGPLVVVRDGAWQSRGTLADIAGTAEFLAMRFDQGQGTASVVGGPGGIELDTTITSARVQDTTAPMRFNPVTASGSANLKNDRWTGRFGIARGARPVAQVVLDHDSLAQAGGMSIDTGTLTFAEGGLQPADLSALVADFISPPVTGAAAFSGRFDWNASGQGSSSGRLTIPGLDFVSPAGPIKGLKGAIAFTSLEPLITAPNQTLTADSLTSVTDLTDLKLTFGLDGGAVTVDGGDIAVGGGTVSIEPFTVPLDRSQGFGGVIVLDRVQLGDLLAGSGFGDKVMLDAVVSGRLPFTSHPVDGVRVTGGSLYAVQPGRLSIDRTALTDIEAGQANVGGTEAAPNTVQDLAYQAMEDLAFDVLTAEVNSLDQGRIGVLFRIKGRHDPPQRQELRLTIAELISRTFLQRELPLPSDTGIDLTLDTTLNANQLVGDLMALNRARNGTPRTPAPRIEPGVLVPIPVP